MAKVIYIVVMLVGIGMIICGRGIVFVRTMIYVFLISGFILWCIYCLVGFLPLPEGK